MKKIDVNPPSGTRDFLPEEVKLREAVFATVKKVFESFGFLPLETPAFERLEVLSGKYGEEGEKLIYKILKRGEGKTKGETDLALRYDLTIPLARVVAKYRDKLPTIFKRYQIGPVWRADRPGKGRFREFYQCDVDTVGTSSLLADAEIILAAVKALGELGLKKFEIRLNSRKILDGIMEIYEVPKAVQKKMLISLDKLDKIGVLGVKKEMEERLSKKIIDQIIEEIKNPKARETIRKRLGDSSTGKIGLEEVDEIIKLVKPFLDGSKIIFSPFLARGLDYYTGPIFEFFSENLDSSVAGGGRYDDLIGIFSGRSTSACGISLGVERIISVLSEKTQKPKKNLVVRILVTVWDKSFREDALLIASGIRKGGVNAELYLGEGNISRQIGLASDRMIPYIAIFGPEEKRRKEVKIKNLKTGEEKSVSITDLGNLRLN